LTNGVETIKHTVVVGTDLSAAADEAIVRAEARARVQSADLIVVRVVSPLLWGVGDQARHLAELEQQVSRRVGSLTGRIAGEYRIIVERGLAHAVLARIAVAENALLVVGAHMQHGLGHALLRDVSERVIERTRGPVLVTRPPDGVGPVLAAVDCPFDQSSALDAGLEEARMAGRDLVVLHCVDTGFLKTLAEDLVNGGAYAKRLLGAQSAARSAQRELRAELRRRRVDASVLVQEGAVESIVPDLAARIRASLVVIGSGHRQQSLHVTTGILRHVPCSALIVDSNSASGLDRPEIRARESRPAASARFEH